MPRCGHGEVTDREIDIFGREAVWIDRVLDPLRQRTPGLKVVMEHITTSDAVDYVQAQDETLGATITVQHLLLDRNDMLVGGIRPHYYCLPILKRGTHRAALVAAATAGPGRFFLGTDSAPHTTDTKENACGCAGCFTAPVALACLAELFEERDALDQLEAFTSLNGPRFYGLPVNTDTITLTKGDPVTYPAHIPTKDGPVTVFDPQMPPHWRATQPAELTSTGTLPISG